MHENLSIALDLDQLLRSLKRKIIIPEEWVDRYGCKRRRITLYAKVCKDNKGSRTHFVTAKSADGNREARNEEGNIIYFGSAIPSRFQPKESKEQTDEYNL